jgi:hypothetical protein
MLEVGRYLDLATEPIAGHPLDLVRMDLDHDQAVERRFPGQEDPRHSSASQLSLELVVRSEHPPQVLLEIGHME